MIRNRMFFQVCVTVKSGKIDIQLDITRNDLWGVYVYLEILTLSDYGRPKFNFCQKSSSATAPSDIICMSYLTL